MNSFKATAQACAAIRSPDIKSAAKDIFRLALNRARLWLLVRFLPLAALAIIGASPAHANGVNTTINSGQIVTGTITSTGIDTYNFPIKIGQSIVVSVSEVGTHSWQPYLSISDPTNTWGASTFDGYSSTLIYQTHSTATWNVTVSAWNAAGGNYKLQFYIVPIAGGIDPNMAGGTLAAGQTAGGSIYRGSFMVYTTNWYSGWIYDHYLTLTKTSGTWDMNYHIFLPDGEDWYQDWSSASTFTDDLTMYPSYPAGTVTIIVNQHVTTPDPTGGYTVSVSGNGVGTPLDGKQDGCPTCHGGGAVVGQPINVATGNMYEQVTDYTTVGTNPLALTRTYNSMSYMRSLYPTLMGPNWRTNYDRYLRVLSASQVMAERPDGRVVGFNLVSSVWTPDTDVDMKLTGSGSSFTLTDSNDVAEAYTVASGQGTLNTLTWPNGYVQTMNYTTSVLTSVSDSYSHSLSFTYTGGVLTGVTTPDSATLTYGYTTVSGQQLLTSVAYNTSPGTNQTYVYANAALPFALTSITDENGNTNSQWTYDGTGRCTMSEHAGGADEIQISYDDTTGNRTVTDPLGNAETYKFSTLQGVGKVNEIDRAANSPVASASRYFTYDTNGYLATATDWDANETTWTNNSHGQPTSITEAYGAGVARTTTISYDSTWVHKPYTTTKTGVTIDDRYDASTGTLTSHTLTDTTGGATNGQTHVSAYTYDGTGQKLTETFPRTGTTVKNTYTYTSGALASITDQLSHAWTVNTANGTGQPTQITDPNSVVTNLVYDNRNRLTSKTVVASPSNEVTGITYISSGQPHVITLPDSSTITYGYNTAQRLTTITNTAGETINYTLNAAGKPTTTTIKDSGGTTKKSSTATYDVLAHMLTRVGSAGGTQTTSFAWDGQGNRTSVTDANSKVWSQAYDALNRAYTVTDPDSHTAAPTYNALDQVTAQTDFDGYSTSFTRDAFGNAIAKSSPDTGSETFTFDEDNNLTAHTDGRSVASAQTFDAADRLTATTFTGYSGENIAYTYDSTSGGNKGVGRQTSFTDESGSTTFVYDSFGNVKSSVRVIGGKTYTTTYSYDLANRVTEIIYPSGRYVDYTYDSNGYLTTVTTKPSSMGSVTTLASSIVHKPFGPVASFTYGNSEALTRTFDNNFWLDDIVTTYSGTDIQNLTFGYDYAGNLTSITDNLAAGRDQTYTVDDLNRLHTASGPYGSRTYTYENNSNRSTWYDGSTTKTSHYNTGTNIPGTITFGSSTRTLTWSGSGNLATDDRTGAGGSALSNTYGGRDRLESLTIASQPVTFLVNALGQRVSKATLSATTHYHYDLKGHLIAESNGSTAANIVEWVYLEDMPLAQIDSSGNIVYIHTDQLNAPEKITNPSRTIVWDREQEPFGEDYSTPTSTTPTDLRFPGQIYDIEYGLNYNGFRDYDPTLGRYIEHDPLGFAAGPNLYGYAGQNPAQWVDPEGLMSEVAPGLAGDLVGATEARPILPNSSITDPAAATPVPDTATGKQCPDPDSDECKQLRQAVDTAQAKVNVLGRCEAGMSDTQVKTRISAWLELATARAKRDEKCYDHPGDANDIGHQTAQAEAWKNLSRCQAFSKGQPYQGESPIPPGLGGI